MVSEIATGLVAGQEKRETIWDCTVLLGKARQEGDGNEMLQVGLISCYGF